MVNKAALGVVGVIVVATLGGGLLLGAILEDPGDANGAEEPGSDGTPASTATPDNTSADSAQRPDDWTHTPVLPRRFSSDDVEAEVTRIINDERAEAGQNELETDGRTAERLQSMARGHSEAMADVGYTGHSIRGVNVTERYRNHDLFDTCRYSDGKNAIYPGYQNHHEIVGSGTIGDYHDSDTFVRNERQAARLVVNESFQDQAVRDRALIEQFELVGVGAEVTGENEVYVTINFCI